MSLTGRHVLVVVWLLHVWGVGFSDGEPLPPISAESGPTSTELNCPPGEKIERVLRSVQGQPVFVRALLSGRMAGYDILDSSGGSLLPPKRNRIFVGEYVYLERFIIAAFAGGQARLELSADATSAAELSLTLVSSDHLRLETRTDPQPMVVGERADLSAALRVGDGPVVGGDPEFSVTITLPKGAKHTARLLDDGKHGDGAAQDGVFGCTVRPMHRGVHRLQFRAKSRVNGKLVERETEAFSFAVSEKGPRFVGSPKFSTPDHDQDGLYEGVVIGFELWLPKGARVEIHTRIVDSGGRTVHSDLHITVMNLSVPGPQSVELMLRGEQIVRMGHDGPWTLTDIRMWNHDAEALVDIAADCVTPTYSSDRFAQPRAPIVRSIQVGGAADTIEVLGRNVGDATRVLIAGVEFPFRVRRRGQVMVERRASMPEDRWADLLEKIQVTEITLITPWGRSIHPRLRDGID